MNKQIIAITDYLGHFESKYNAIPYRSGMEKSLIKKYFDDFGIQVEFIKFSDVIDFPRDYWEGKPIIYTSSEDTNYQYKSFIEDVIYYLELCNANTLPRFKYLKANNNKVFMELLRKQLNGTKFDKLNTKIFGTLEEAQASAATFKYPVVFKEAAGAMSRGVGSGSDEKLLMNKLKKISRTSNYFQEIWEIGRSFKHKKYLQESRHRKKFILQEFIPGLNCDYKVLIFSDKLFVLRRGVKYGDFRASGSGIRHFVKDLPKGLLEFAYDFYEKVNVPCVSLDIAFDGSVFFLIEFQCLYFGSYTLTFSEFYWTLINDKFEFAEGESELEYEYVRSIANYLKD